MNTSAAKANRASSGRHRPYPPRMHENSDRTGLYHLWRNKWRHIGHVDDMAAALERYREIEETIVIPEREEAKQRRAELRNLLKRLHVSDLRRLHRFALDMAVPSESPPVKVPASTPSAPPVKVVASTPSAPSPPPPVKVPVRSVRRWCGYYGGGTRVPAQVQNSE